LLVLSFIAELFVGTGWERTLNYSLLAYYWKWRHFLCILFVFIGSILSNQKMVKVQMNDDIEDGAICAV
jgi:hypothetical protein